MEENSLTPNQNPLPNGKGRKWNLHALAFLEVGLFELVFVSIVLALLFGILNYFNILPVSSVFPKYFSWLPRQHSQPKTIPIIVKRTIPSPTPIYPPAPEYAVNDTKILLKDILIPSLIPSNFVFQKQNIENPYGYTFYGTGWKTKSGETFVATVEYNQANVLTDKQIVIHVIPQITEVLNASKSSNLISRYFKQKPEQEFSCVKLPVQNIDSIFCEAFWQDKNGVKKGINVNSPILGLQETRIFYCEHTQDSSGYSWKSCDLRYKNTGIETASQSASL